MVKLTKSERNKLEKRIRAKHGNLKMMSELTKVSHNTLKTAYKGGEISEQSAELIKTTLANL